MSTKETILEILEDIKPGVDAEGKTDLVTGGSLKSFDVLLLVTEINNEFGIQIPLEEIVPANFDSIDAAAALTDRLKG